MSNPYFSFPLCLFAQNKTEEEIFTEIFSYALCNYSIMVAKKEGLLTNDESYSQIKEIDALEIDYDNQPEDFDEGEPIHQVIAFGTMRLKVSVGSIEDSLNIYEETKRYISGYEIKYGTDAKIRVKSSIYWAASNKEIKFMDFVVFCALLSSLGDSKYKQVTAAVIQIRACGSKSKIVFEKEGLQMVYTIKQVRSSLNRLYENNFFARITVFNRFTYYSIRMDEDKLREEFQNKKSGNKNRAGKEKDKELNQKLRQGGK